MECDACIHVDGMCRRHKSKDSDQYAMDVEEEGGGEVRVCADVCKYVPRLEGETYSTQTSSMSCID